MHLVAHQIGVGPREVDELEDAQLCRCPAGSISCTDVQVALDRDVKLAGTHLAHERGAHDVERGRLRSQGPAFGRVVAAEPPRQSGRNP